MSFQLIKNNIFGFFAVMSKKKLINCYLLTYYTVFLLNLDSLYDILTFCTNIVRVKMSFHFKLLCY